MLKNEANGNIGDMIQMCIIMRKFAIMCVIVRKPAIMCIIVRKPAIMCVIVRNTSGMLVERKTEKGNTSTVQRQTT